jgi:hypothetical protein
MSLHQRVESMVLFYQLPRPRVEDGDRAVRLRTRSTPYDHITWLLAYHNSRRFPPYEIGCESVKTPIVHYTEQSTVQVIVRELFQQGHPQSDGSLNGPPEDQGQTINDTMAAIRLNTNPPPDS